MGLFISFDHLFQVALSLCLPPPSHYLFFVLFFFFVLFIIFIQFPVACARNDSESTVTQKSSSNAPAVSRGQSSPGEAALAMCCCCHVRCLLNQKLRTFDQPHMTAPPPCKSPPSAPFSPLSSWKPIRIPLWKVATHHLILFYVLKVANRKQIKKRSK